MVIKYHFLAELPIYLQVMDMFCLIFTESALRPIQSVSRDVRLFVCLFVCGFVGHTLETTLPEGLETSGRMAYR